MNGGEIYLRYESFYGGRNCIFSISLQITILSALETSRDIRTRSCISYFALQNLISTHNMNNLIKKNFTLISVSRVITNVGVSAALDAAGKKAQEFYEAFLTVIISQVAKSSSVCLSPPPRQSLNVIPGNGGGGGIRNSGGGGSQIRLDDDDMFQLQTRKKMYILGRKA